MKPDIDRRTFIKRMGQAGGLIVAGGTLESFLAACGGNIVLAGGKQIFERIFAVHRHGLAAQLVGWRVQRDCQVDL